MDTQESTREITFSDLWGVFVQHLFPIALAGILVCLGAYFGSRALVAPRYNSTATLYVLKQSNEDYVYTSSDFSLALNVVNDCSYMIRSRAVLEDALREVDTDLSYGALHSSLSTSNPSGTRVLEISVKTDNPALSKQLVDKICTIAAQKISAAMGFEQVSVYEYGTLEAAPCNRLGVTKCVLFGVAMAVLIYGIYLIVFLMDDRIRSEEDVLKYLNLSVLATIPNSEDSRRRGNRYSRYYSSDRKEETDA